VRSQVDGGRGGVTGAQAEKLAAGVPAVWGDVPQRNKNFTGRTELLADLRKRVTTEATALVPHALHGLGGVGKTQLAIEYAHRYASDYEVIWWIRADQAALVRSSLAGLAQRLGISGVDPGRVEESVAAVLDALRRGEPHARWLLVFDNADQPELIEAFMPRGPGDVIITSRNRTWERVADALEVNVFTRQESREFLRLCVDGISDADADRLAEEFGDLPLGLEQAAAWLAQTAMAVDQYLDLLREEHSRILAENPPPPGYPVPVAAAWSVSVARLRTQTPDAMELLQFCAFFGPAPIPLEFLELGRFRVDPPLQNTLKDPILLGRAIRALGRYALARIDNHRRTLEVHRIIQRLIRDELDGDTRNRLRHGVHMVLAAADPGDPDDVDNWPKYAELLGHVGPSEVVKSQDPEDRRLAQNIVRYLLITGDYREALRSADKALGIWSADSEPDDFYILVMTRLKVQILQSLANYQQAYALSAPTLGSMSRVLGVNHEETLILMNCRCIDLWARGEFAESVDFTEATLKRHQEVFGDDHPRTFAAKNNFAEAKDLNGDYGAARKLQSELYNEKLTFYGRDDHPRVLFTLDALGRTTLAQGRFAEALQLLEQAYNFFQRHVEAQVLLESNSWVLQQAVDLSIARRAMGNYADALSLAQGAYERHQRTYLSPAHPRTLAAAVSLGNAQRLAGDVAAAAELLTETSRQYEEVFGGQHPYSLGSKANLAITRRYLGDLAGARTLLESTAEGLSGRLGPQHHHTLICHVDLASALAELGDVEQATRRGEDAYKGLAAVLGEDHPHTLASAANLAIDLRALGRGQRADELAESTRGRYQRILGSDHPEAQAAAAGRRIDVAVELYATF
jgi:tetratricopeptide (TPR) repeat protein